MRGPNRENAKPSLRMLAALLCALLCLAPPSGAGAESFLDWLLNLGGKKYLLGWEMGATPYLEIDGLELMPVYFTGDTDLIREIVGDAMPDGRQVWYVRLEVLNGPAEEAAVRKAAAGVEMWLYKGSGYEIPSCRVLIDGDPASEAGLLFRYDGPDRFSGFALMYKQKTYPLDDLRDSPTPTPVPTATPTPTPSPAPTPTPEPTPTPVPFTGIPPEAEQAFREEKSAVYGASMDSHPVLHIRGCTVLIVVFNRDNEVVLTSLDAGGADYCGIPRELLAPSREEADEMIYIYPYFRSVGTYTDGSGALRAEALVSVIRGGEYNCLTLVSHEPPKTKTGSGSRSGVYDPWEAVRILAERIMKAENAE